MSRTAMEAAHAVGAHSVVSVPYKCYEKSATRGLLLGAPECRGHGRALLDAVMLHARSAGGIRSLKLGVNAENESAKRLYQAAGFRHTGTDPEAIVVDGTYYDEHTHVRRLADPD